MGKTALAYAALAAWGLVVLVAAGILLVGHLFAFSAPENETKLRAELARAPMAASVELNVVHVLSVDCRCSARIFERLRQRGPIPGVHERIVWVESLKGTTAPVSLAFDAETMALEAVGDRFGALSAPVMIVGDRIGRVRYAGGYTKTKQGPFIADVRILDELRRGRDVPPLPVFGCPVDPDMQRRIDPIGLR